MKFRPLHDRIVVKRIEAEAKSAGGIIIWASRSKA
jgi:chaperonin GroES